MHAEEWWYGKNCFYKSRTLFVHTKNTAVFNCDLESEWSVLGLILCEFSFYKVCLFSVPTKAAVKLHSPAQLRTPRNIWDSFHIEFEYIFDDFVFWDLPLLTIFWFVFYNSYIESHDLIGSWPTI